MAEYRLDIVGSAEGLLTGLNNAQEALQEVSAEAVATGKATQAAFAQTGGIEKMQRSLKDQFIFLGKTEVQLNKLRTALKSTFDPKEVQALNVQMKATTDSLIKFDSELTKTDTVSKSLKAQLRENKAILAEMEEQGLETTKSFFNLQVATGKLQDQINDTNERIKFFASDTKGLDGLIGVTKLATAGFAVGQGAAALFGAENENVQKALLKVNAAMAILNGLQEIQQALQKSSAARITLETAARKIKLFFLGAEKTATEGLVVAEGKAIVMSKALRAALISIGIGAVIGLLIWAASAMGLFDDKIKKTTDDIEKQKKALDDLRATIQFNADLQIAEAKRLGANDETARAIAAESRKKDIQALKDYMEERRKIRDEAEKRFYADATKDNFTFFDNAQKAYTESLDNLTAARRADKVARVNDVVTGNEEVKKVNEEFDKKEAERSKKAAEAAIKRTQHLLDLNKKLNEQNVQRLLEINKKFNKLVAKPAVDLEKQEAENKEILAGKVKFLDDLETIALLQKDIEFEQGTKSIAETRRISQEKLDIEIDFAQRRLDLLLASGGDEGQIKALQLAIEKGKNQLKEAAENGSNADFLKAIGLGDISEEDLGKIIEGVKIIANSIKQIFSDLLDGAINSNETLIQNLDDQISKVQANIEKQEALQREGQANNLAAERENLDRLQAERLKAFEKQKQLERQKLTLDAVTQVSSMITASANIFKSLSPLGPVGVALAVVAIASMFAAFANSQVQARKAINQQTLGKGGLVKGKRHDADGWGGERYVSDSGNETYIEDGEYVVNRKQSQKYRHLIEAINNDNLKQMLNGTGVQLSEDKIEAHKQLKQGYNDAQIVRQMGLSGGDNNTEKLRKDFNDFRNEQKTKSVITYQDGKRIEIRGNRTIITRLK